MQRIFISYSRADVEFARKLATSLSDLGSDVWIDIEDIPVGMKWSSAIQEGLRTADAMLVVISPESMGSSNVEDEWQYFMDKQKPVFPILWRETEEVHFQLNRLQYIDFKNYHYDRALSMLIEKESTYGSRVLNNAPLLELFLHKLSLTTFSHNIRKLRVKSA